MVDTGDELIAPSGAPVTATGFGLFVLADGRIREATIWWQFLGPLDQIRLLTSGSLQVGGFGRVVRDT
jgi:hypothetical protein